MEYPKLKIKKVEKSISSRFDNKFKSELLSFSNEYVGNRKYLNSYVEHM